ncbi:MAG: LruC domain-containing protein [Bacteroidales bacterium]|nr:LruC domain-containing protein [Bacteroidales bacterium]
MKKLILLIVIFGTVLASCRKPDPNPNPGEEPNPVNSAMEDLIISEDFNFSTTKVVNFNIKIEDINGNAYNKIPVIIYDRNRMEEGARILYKGITNIDGEFISPIVIPTYIDSVYIASNYIGVANIEMVSVASGNVNLSVGGIPEEGRSFKSAAIHSNTLYNLAYLGGYDNYGKPDYLEPERDVVDQEFLNDLNATFPEGSYLFNTHPQYFDATNDHNIKLVNESDIWITFVHEGAGFKNVVGFYTYDVANPPSSKDEIDEITIIFPNASANGSGGKLYAGDKVKIGHFEANTGIGFVIFANAWRSGGVNPRDPFVYYPTPAFNPESSQNKRQHTVLVADNIRERYVIAFEDLHRQNQDIYNCDHDFNDLIIYATATEYDDVDQTEIPEIDDDSPDSDGDGVHDDNDDFPDDPDRAFANIFEGTLAYEDLWPQKGDYDFNDIVIDYELNQLTNSDNKVTQLDASFILKAYGASFHNGFAFQLDLAPSLIENVTGMDLSDNPYIQFSSNNTEAEQSKAVILVFEDCYKTLTYPGGGIGVNTTPTNTYYAPATVNISVKFNTPVDAADLGTAPYNPFIIVDGNREHEVHLPDQANTDLADVGLFTSADDTSDPDNNRYYKTATNLPWAINIAEGFDYPIEKTAIIEAHLKFAAWAESSGVLFPDWYKDKPTYRNDANIYQIPE